MKIISNILKGSAFVVVTLIATTVVTFDSKAIEGSNTTADSSAIKCQRLITLMSATEERLNARLQPMQKDFEVRLANVASRQDAIDQKVRVFRTTTHDEFAKKVSELRAKEGLSEAQFAAINAYETAMNDTEAMRQQKVDDARAAYRFELLRALQTYQLALSQGAVLFQTTVHDAFSKSRDNCTNGTPVTTLKATLQTAQESFKAIRNSTAIKLSIKQLNESRQNLIKKANADFAKQIKTHSAVLKTILGNKE